LLGEPRQAIAKVTPQYERIAASNAVNPVSKWKRAEGKGWQD